MANCNTAQNELGGKDLILKACKLVSAATTNLSDNITITAHALIVGDLVKFQEVGALTSFDTDTYYFVVTVVDANTVELSATRAGAAIVADATEAALAADAFQSFGGLRSKSMSFSSDAIDITNHDSDQYKKILDGAGIRSMAFSGSGVYTNETVFQAVFTRARQNLLTCLMLIDVKNDILFEACFKITSLEVSGDYDAEGAYSISGDSSGEITVYTAP